MSLSATTWKSKSGSNAEISSMRDSWLAKRAGSAFARFPGIARANRRRALTDGSLSLNQVDNFSLDFLPFAASGDAH